MGRERDLRTLEATFDECVDESAARVVLVTGPAGLGKTRLRREFLRPREQVGKDHDLGSQLLGWNWGEDEINCTGRVEVDVKHLVFGVGRDEDDRGHLGLPALTDQRCGLEAVHTRHEDVEENDGKVLGEETTQCSAPRVRLHEAVTERGEHGLQRQSLGRVVVDYQDGNRMFVAFAADQDVRAVEADGGSHVARIGTVSQGPMAATRSLVLTGFGT